MLLSANIASSVPRKPPAAAIVRKGLKASGGQLSWASQSVSVRLRTRSGFNAAKICAIPPPLSLPTRSTWPMFRSEGLGRPVVLGVAVSEREAANAFRVQRGENLRNTATAVVADQIYLADVQGIDKFLEHLRISSHRYVLIRRYLCVAMCKQIHSDTSPDV